MYQVPWPSAGTASPEGRMVTRIASSLYPMKRTPAYRSMRNPAAAQ
jgi:hypothetical protein